MATLNAPIHFFEYMKVILKIFIPLVVLALGFNLFVYKLELRNIKDSTAKEMQIQVNALRYSLNRELDMVAEDLLLLAHNHDLHKYLNIVNEENLSTLNQDWRQFSGNRKQYDQIRFIENNGIELVRINLVGTHGHIVSSDKLQNKRHRYYFEESIQLSEDEIYLSPFDLNKEHGEVEVPRKPMLRFATPVFDKNGVKRGIVIINYLGSRLLDILSASERVTGGKQLLLNEQGFYLEGFRFKDEWAFMLPEESKPITFSNEFPGAWSVINKKLSGQIQDPKGLITFEHIYFPKNIATPHLSIQREWIVINFISTAKLKEIIQPLFHLAWISNVGMFIALLLISWLISYLLMQRREALKALKQSEERSRLMLESTTDGVYCVDEKGLITFANPAMSKLLGYSITELINTPNYQQICNPESGNKPQKNVCCIERAITSKTIQYMTESQFYRKNGTSFPVEYTVSPLNNSESENSLAVVVFRDITNRKDAERLLKIRATTDSLTGCFNRSKFEEVFEHELARTRRYKTPLSLAIFDVDHFKKVNDNYGHSVGDGVLKMLVRVVRHLLRDTDTLIRWGGEEFAILASDTSLEGMHNLAEKIRVAVAEYPFDIVKTITISIGISIYQADESDKAFFNRVDKALYEAKHSGRNCVRPKK